MSQRNSSHKPVQYSTPQSTAMPTVPAVSGRDAHESARNPHKPMAKQTIAILTSLFFVVAAASFACGFVWASQSALSLPEALTRFALIQAATMTAAALIGVVMMASASWGMADKDSKSAGGSRPQKGQR